MTCLLSDSGLEDVWLTDMIFREVVQGILILKKSGHQLVRCSVSSAFRVVTKVFLLFVAVCRWMVVKTKGMEAEHIHCVHRNWCRCLLSIQIERVEGGEVLVIVFPFRL